MRRSAPPIQQAILVGAIVPLAVTLWQVLRGTIGANPIAEALNRFGLLALIFLILALAMTPLRALFNWSWPIRVRRTLGLIGFGYAALHLSTYAGVDQGLRLDAVLQDVVKRKFIFVGFAAFLLLIPLAVTSTNGMVRRLGFKRWQKLHRLAYAATVLGVIHFVWRVKKDKTQPFLYGAVLAILLGIRLVRRLRGGKTKKAAPRRTAPRLGPAAAAAGEAAAP